MRPLLEEKCLRLADLSYRAVDADKSGLNVNGVSSDLRAVSRPHFMDAGSDSRCRRQMPRISRSPVGQMFDLVRQEMDVLEGHHDAIPELDNTFDFNPGPEECSKWENLVAEYSRKTSDLFKRTELCIFERIQMLQELYASYRMELYGGPHFGGRTKKKKLILREASALHLVVHRREARRVEKEKGCGKTSRADLNFAWRVAVAALIEIKVRKEKITCLCVAPGAERYMRKRNAEDSQVD